MYWTDILLGLLHRYIYRYTATIINFGNYANVMSHAIAREEVFHRGVKASEIWWERGADISRQCMLRNAFILVRGKQKRRLKIKIWISYLSRINQKSLRE